jgi:diguanylate cyclase (GGDEF)-like protein/PAS domain S-box-containing protein
MPTLPRLSHAVTLTVGVGVLAVLLSSIGWPDPRRSLEFSLLMLAALVTSLPALQAPNREWPALGSSFVIEFTSLMIFGPLPTMIVAGCGIVARGLLEQQRVRRPWHLALNVAAILASLQAAGWAHRALGGTLGHFVWPWQAVPIAASVLAYCMVTSIAAAIVAPRLVNWRIGAFWRSWPRRLLEECPVYFVGASVAAGLVEMLARHKWDVLVVTAAPLYLAYRVYCDHVNRLEHEHRRSEAIESLSDGVCIVDRTGKVTLWNDALERLLECPRDRTIGRSLRFAVNGLADTDLPRALDDVAKSRAPRTLAEIRLRCSAGLRILQVKLVPGSGGITLLWQDVTEHTRAVQTLQRHRERLALAAEVANDGLWEWDLSTKQFYVTGRWKAMVGLPPNAGVNKPEEWLDRVHRDDIGALQEALEAHLSGKSDRFQHEHRIRHHDGRYKFFQCRGITTKRGNGRAIRIAGSLTDTTDLAVTQERLRNAVFLDPLTGLCNRAVFVEELGRRLEEFHRDRGKDPFALLYLDLDRFKVVNDSLGHLVGDELLVAVSRRLETCLREGDILARLGGDEFAILLTGLQSEQQANVVAFRVQETLSQPFSIGGREVFTSASIGIAFGVPQYASPDEMMHDADTAMYQAKAHGKARHEVFDADMDARARDRLGLENDLRHAVNWNDFEVHYQPIVSLDSGMCVGFESLVRWTRNGKPVSPAIFIPIAEELGLIEALGTRVLEEACRTFASWQRAFPGAGLDHITVNVSSRQLMQQNFLSVVERAVRKARLEPSALRIEITETALMTSPDVAAKVLTELRDFGVKIYLDDFGTGYSSLSHLHKLPVDALKIDRSFVRSLLLPDRPAIVESILALARTLDTSVVAEGIETDVQAHELERLGCTHAQGYLFSPPVSMAAAQAILSANRPLGPKSAEAAEQSVVSAAC